MVRYSTIFCSQRIAVNKKAMAKVFRARFLAELNEAKLSIPGFPENGSLTAPMSEKG